MFNRYFLGQSLPYEKPSYPCTIDQSHPLAQGLIHAFVFNEGSGKVVRDLVVGAQNTNTSALPNWISSIRGPVLDFDGTDDYLTIPALDTRFLGPLTVVTMVCCDASKDNVLGGKHTGNGGTNNPFDFRVDSTETIQLVRAHATTYRRYSGPTITLNTYQILGFTVADGLCQTVPIFYINGKPTTGTLQLGSATGNVTGNNANIRLGQRADGTTELNGKQVFFYCWDRALTDVEMKWLRADPYCFIIPVYLNRLVTPESGLREGCSITTAGQLKASQGRLNEAASTTQADQLEGIGAGLHRMMLMF